MSTAQPVGAADHACADADAAPSNEAVGHGRGSHSQSQPSSPVAIATPVLSLAASQYTSASQPVSSAPACEQADQRLPLSTSTDADPAAEGDDSLAGDLKFGVGSTVLTRNAERDEFEIHTVGRLTKRGDKLFLNYPSGKSRHGPAVPLNQLFLAQPLEVHSLKSGQRVWALFDLNLTRTSKGRGTRAAPVWTTVYYSAEVSWNQQGVPTDSVRVTSRDVADWGKPAIIPAQTDPLGISHHGLMIPRPLNAAEIVRLRALPKLSAPTAATSMTPSAAAAAGLTRNSTNAAARLQPAPISAEHRAAGPRSPTSQTVSTCAPIGVRHGASAAAAADGSVPSQLVPPGADRHDSPSTAAAPPTTHPAAAAHGVSSTVAVIQGVQNKTRPATGSQSARARSVPSAQSMTPCAPAETDHASDAAADRSVSGAITSESDANLLSSAATSSNARSRSPAGPSAPEAGDGSLAARMRAVASEAAAAVELVPQLRRQLAERDQQLSQAQSQLRALKRKAAGELEEARRDRDAAWQHWLQTLMINGPPHAPAAAATAGGSGPESSDRV